MKTLKGIDELKYFALLAAYLYDQTGNKIYRYALQRIIDEVWRKYGPKGMNKVVDFIYEERL